MVRSAPFVGRVLLGAFFAGSTAVEVGTYRGSFASQLAPHFRKLYCVDPYIPGYDDEDPLSPLVNDAVYEKTKVGLPVNCELLRTTSERAAATLSGPFDLVYIDACHKYTAVRQDLELWWPKTRVLAGHDFTGSHPGVQRTVLEFAVQHDVDVFLIPETDAMEWSWYYGPIPPR